MATQTLLRTVSSVDDVRAVLSNSTLRRLLSIGSTWNKIRVGVRLIVNGSAAVVGTPRFAMGVCSGTANPFNNGSASTDHFVGAATKFATWGYSGNIFYINGGTADWLPTKRVGTTTTEGTTLVGSLVLPSVTLAKRWCLFLDIEKGSPNHTLQAFYTNNTLAADTSKETFLSTVEVEACSLTHHAFGTARTLAVDEGTDGALNAVNISWDRTSPTIEICDIALVRFS